MSIYAGSISGSSLTGSLSYTNLTSVPAGIISSSTQVAASIPAGTVSSSVQINTGSFSGSITSASYVSPSGLPAGTVSSSGQVDYNSITNKLSGVVSASAQVAPLLPTGTVSSSVQINTGSFSGSITSASYAVTASYAANSGGGIPAGTVSSSVQINTGSFSGSFKGDGSGLTNLPIYVSVDAYQYVGDGVTTNYTVSRQYSPLSLMVSVAGLQYADTTDYTLSGFTVSFLTAPPSGSNILIRSYVSSTSQATGSFTGSFIGVFNGTFPYTSLTSIPSGIFSSSAQLPTGTVSSSGQVSYSGLTSIPLGIVSSSTQVTPLLPSGTVSSSGQVSYTGLSNIPSGIVSSSTQVAPLLPTGTVSSSTQVTALLPTGTVSSSTQVVAGVAVQTIAPSIINATGAISGASIQTSGNGIIGGTLAVTGVGTFSSTQDSTTGGLGSIVSSGGIYSTKRVLSATEMLVAKAGSDTAFAGPVLSLGNAANTKTISMQLDSTESKMKWFYYPGNALMATLDSGGSLTLPGTLAVTGLSAFGAPTTDSARVASRINDGANPGGSQIGITAKSNFWATSDGWINGSPQISFGASGTTYAPAAIGMVATSQTANTYGDLVFATRSVTTDTQPTERLRITSSGFIGVGTSSVSSILHLKKDGSGNGVSTIYECSSGTVTNWILGIQNHVSSAFEITPSTAVGGLTFTTPAFIILGNSNVGIGTTTPSYKLDVNGTLNINGAFTGATTGTFSGAVTLTGAGSDTVGAAGSISSNTSGLYRGFFLQHNAAHGVSMYVGNVAENDWVRRFILNTAGSLTLGATDGTGVGALYAGAATFSSTLAVTGAATFSSTVISKASIDVWKAGSDTTFAGPYLAVTNAGNTKSIAMQLDSTESKLKWFYWPGNSLMATLDSAGSLTLAGTLAVTGAATLSSTLAVNAPTATDGQIILNADAGNSANLRFRSASTDKWLITRDSSSNLIVYNSALSANTAIFYSTGGITFSSTLGVTGSIAAKAGIVVGVSGTANAPQVIEYAGNTTTVSGGLGTINWYNYQWDSAVKASIVATTDTALSNGRLTLTANTVAVSGAATFSSTLAVTGSVTLAGTILQVNVAASGLAQFTNTSDVGQALFSNGAQSSSNRWMRLGWDGTNHRFVFNDYESGADRGRISNTGSFDWLGAATFSGTVSTGALTATSATINGAVAISAANADIFDYQMGARGLLRVYSPSVGAQVWNARLSDNSGYSTLTIGSGALTIVGAATFSSTVTGGLVGKTGTYTPGSTTVDVTGVSYMSIANSSAISITNFTGGVNGQILILNFSDSNTTITRNNCYLGGGANFTSTSADILVLVFQTPYWYEISRSANS